MGDSKVVLVPKTSVIFSEIFLAVDDHQEYEADAAVISVQK
jgi:hypothetical protein